MQFHSVRAHPRRSSDQCPFKQSSVFPLHSFRFFQPCEPTRTVCVSSALNRIRFLHPFSMRLDMGRSGLGFPIPSSTFPMHVMPRVWQRDLYVVHVLIAHALSPVSQVILICLTTDGRSRNWLHAQKSLTLKCLATFSRTRVSPARFRTGSSRVSVHAPGQSVSHVLWKGVVQSGIAFHSG